MKLSDLLDELRTNILNDRGASSGADDKLWSDATLVRYINEAQRRFAVRSMIIRDASTAEVVNVTLQTGVTSYALHPAVLAVVSARLDGLQSDMHRTGHSVLGRANIAPDNWDLSLAPTTAPGKPLAFATDDEVGYDDNDTVSTVMLRVFPAPSADYNGTLLKLRVTRKPLDDLTTNNLSAVPEIPADHHLEMLDWAAYLALRIIDQDAGSPQRAQEFAASFETHVQAARTMVMRKLFAPMPYGFGKNGWTWGS
jgi:hypothetical protein